MKQIALDIGLSTGPTLASYFPGSNEAAWRHLEQWAGVARSVDPEHSPVPSYFWGAQGSGKTHLLKAAQAALREQGARIGWAAVIFDDVHLFTPAQQQVAFNWFVNAQTHRCALLAAGAVPPVELKLRDDVRTRLGWGHVYQLQLLGESERRAVLRQSADARGVFLGDDVMDFMLTRFSRDLGSLLELLDLIDNYALQTKRAITIPLIKSMMEES